MTANDPLPARVSDEDRRKAVAAVDTAIGEWCEETNVGPLTRNVLNATIVNALVSHGWGPKPVIYCETVLDHVSTPEAAASLIDVLLQNGIEVRD